MTSYQLNQTIALLKESSLFLGDVGPNHSPIMSEEAELRDSIDRLVKDLGFEDIEFKWNSCKDCHGQGKIPNDREYNVCFACDGNKGEYVRILKDEMGLEIKKIIINNNGKTTEINL